MAIKWYALSAMSVALCSVQAKLVEVSSINKNIIIDMRYAGDNNAAGCCLMDRCYCLAEEDMAIALDQVQHELESRGLSLVIWNAYESPSVRDQLQHHLISQGQMPNLDAHAAGRAVDVTMARDGKLLSMPTDFDCLTCQVERLYSHESEEIQENCSLLETIMTSYGFIPGEEWYHFEYETHRACQALEIEP